MARKKTPMYFLVVLLSCLLSAGALAEPEILPVSYDFGDVTVGSSTFTIFTLTNHAATAFAITELLVLPEGTDFSVTAGPALWDEVAPGETVDIEVTFSPSAAGDASAYLTVSGRNGGDSSQYIPLTGTGVEDPPGPSVSIADILAFFDASVADGTLPGDGPGNSADGRRGALRNMLEAAGTIIDSGDDACQQLMDSWERCDGQPRPPDFVAGTAAPELNAMIAELMADLGCD